MKDMKEIAEKIKVLSKSKKNFKKQPPRAVLKYRNNKSISRRNKNLSFLSLLLLLEESKELHISLLLVFYDDDNYDDAQEQRETGITHQIKEERERERERIDFTISLWGCLVLLGLILITTTHSSSTITQQQHVIFTAKRRDDDHQHRRGRAD